MVNLADLPNAAALSGSETLPMQQGSGAVKVTANSLLSRAAGQVLPFEVGGQRVVTINANGLGVGTLAPAYGIEVYGGSNQAKSTVLVNGAADAPGTLRLGAGGSVYALSALPGASGITFTQVGVGEQARLYQGSFLVGQVAPNWTFVNKAPGATIAATGLIKATRNELSLMLHRTDSNGPVAQFGRDTSVVGSIAVTESATAYNTASDYRLAWKAGHTEVTNSGDFIDALNPRYFPLVGHAGFIAHEFQEVSPSSVTGDKDAVDENGDPVYQAMQASSPDVMANIIAELQSLRKRVAALEAAT